MLIESKPPASDFDDEGSVVEHEEETRTELLRKQHRQKTQKTFKAQRCVIKVK